MAAAAAAAAVDAAGSGDELRPGNCRAGACVTAKR